MAVARSDDILDGHEGTMGRGDCERDHGGTRITLCSYVLEKMILALISINGVNLTSTIAEHCLLRRLPQEVEGAAETTQDGLWMRTGR